MLTSISGKPASW